MFARAGISSRAFRGEHTGGFFGRPKKKKKEKRKFRCYVPFMWSTCVALWGGFSVLCGGTAMCITGYYAANFTSIQVSNQTHTWSEVDPIPYALMWNMTYVGPVLMGFGCFAMVIACVVVCETRDKMLRIMENDEKLGKKTTTKPDFYDLVIKKFKKEPVVPIAVLKHVATKQTEATGVDFVPPPRRKSIFNMLLRRSSIKSIKSTKSEFAHIGSALRNIPMEIFAIDVDQKTKTSLLPISLTLGVDICGMRLPVPNQSLDSDLYLAPKYPSASCIVDLLKLNEEKLTALFPDMDAWLAEVQPLSRKWRRMTRDKLVPFSPKDATHSESRDADDSDSDSLCSVTVHVQPAKEKPQSNLLDVPARTNDGNIFQFPPSPDPAISDNRPHGTTGGKPGGLMVPNVDRGHHDGVRRGQSCDTETAHRPTHIDKLGIPRGRRRSLLRQKPVTEDSFPLKSPPDKSAAQVESTRTEPTTPVRHEPRTVCDKSDHAGISPPAEHAGMIVPNVAHTNNVGLLPCGLDTGRARVSPMTPIVPETHTNTAYTTTHRAGTPDNDLMKTFDIPKTNSRTLLCSNDSDEVSECTGETNRLLGDVETGTQRRPATTPSDRRAHQQDAQTPHAGKNKIFVPYLPQESNARTNCHMQKSKPVARSLTNLSDQAVFGHIRTSHPHEVTSFARHPLDAHFYVEAERLPMANQMKRSKTALGVTENAS